MNTLLIKQLVRSLDSMTHVIEEKDFEIDCQKKDINELKENHVKMVDDINETFRQERQRWFKALEMACVELERVKKCPCGESWRDEILKAVGL